ncbi:hypothetical protein L195_g057739 [Trifolium pratense]|uniref:Uncharacterized protein n=1 Tax=Trifolium pratense TaxID=57577 RepID=A0A2K3KWW5_TRIPR|nr:hypothetical protein L195_g057739 [Trifolium pratense]
MLSQSVPMAFSLRALSLIPRGPFHIKKVQTLSSPRALTLRG